MSSLYTTAALLKCTACSVCFHQWNMDIYVSNKHRICFLFLLLSPKRDFTTYCILSTYLKITYPNRKKKNQFIHFWSPHCFWVPHHQLERLLHILCQRSESVSWHYFYILPSSHIFPLEISNSFHKGFTLSAEAKKILFPAQTLSLTQCNELLVIWGLLLLGWLTSHNCVSGTENKSHSTQHTADTLHWTRPQVRTRQLLGTLTSGKTSHLCFTGLAARKLSYSVWGTIREQCGTLRTDPQTASCSQRRCSERCPSERIPFPSIQPRGGRQKSVPPKPLYGRYYIYIIWLLSVFHDLNQLSEVVGFKVLPATWTRAPPPAHQTVRVVVLSWFVLELFSTSLKQEFSAIFCTTESIDHFNK